MRIVSTNTLVYTEGYTSRKEHGPAIRRENTNYEHVQVPMGVPRPQIEDFNSLVVVSDKVEYYS